MFTPEVNLTYLDGVNPKYYAVTVKVGTLQIAGKKFVLDRQVPTAVDLSNNLFIEVHTSSESHAVDELRIELGAIALDQSSGTVEIVVIDGGSNIAGSKKVRAAEAQMESRPIGGK